MPSFANVVSVVERPVGTTLAVAGTAGAGTITVDDISRLTWPAGGLRIGTEQFIYSVDAAPDQSVDTIDLDEDDEGSDEIGTITLGGQTLNADYDIDEPVVQFQQTVVTERIATVLLPDEAEELVLRVPRQLWDRLPADIRQREGPSETVALEDSGGEWVMTDVVAEDPSVDASFINALTLPQTVTEITGTGADDAGFFDETWTAPGNVTANDATYAHAVGTSASAAVTPHNTGFTLPGTGANDSGTGTLSWSDPAKIEAKSGSGGGFGGDVPPSLSTSAFTSIGTGSTQRLQATDFGFSVPAGATITGITVEVTRAAANTNAVFDLIVKLIKGGSIVGTDNSSPTTWPTNFASATYGGDLWGTTWTPAQVNASDFGISLQATHAIGTYAMVDAIRVRVNYTTTSTTEFRSNTHFLRADNFGFGIPDEARITGITAEVERHASDDTGVDYARDNQVRLTNGTDVSNDVGVGLHWPTSDAVATYGGDLWGLPWTPDDINDSAFGLLISADVNFGVTASIDFIRLTVAYVTAGDA